MRKNTMKAAIMRRLLHGVATTVTLNELPEVISAAQSRVRKAQENGWRGPMSSPAFDICRRLCADGLAEGLPFRLGDRSRPWKLTMKGQFIALDL